MRINCALTCTDVTTEDLTRASFCLTVKSVKRTPAKNVGGRPKSSRATIKMVNFRADQPTIEAIDKLEAAVAGAVAGARSMAIRTAILEAAERLDARLAKGKRS
jgi:hypothetical protein